jgi:hypothetical protein
VTLLRHILAKDFRRLRWLLLAWLVIVVSRVAVTAARSDFAFDDVALQVALEEVSQILMMIDLPVLVLLVSWLVHDEPLLGADAFWLTRPIPPMTLMGAKLAFAALFLVGAPAVAQSIAVAIALRSPGHASRLIPGLLSSQSLWVAALVALATLTASLTRFLLTLVAAAAAVIVALSALFALMLLTIEETSYPSPGPPDQTAAVVGSWLFVAVALAVIGLQYRTRRLRLAVPAGMAGVIVSALIAEAWPWPVARPPEPDPGAWARDSTSVAAVLEAGEPYVTDELLVRRRASRKKQIAAPIRLTGVPLQYGTQSTGVRSRLEFAGGPTIQSAQGGTVAVSRGPGDQRASDYMAPVRAALLPSRLVGRIEEPQVAQWPVVLTLTADEYERYGRIPGQLTVTIEAFLQESRLVASIPLEEGRIAQAGSTAFELRRVIRRPDGCSLLIREKRVPGGQLDAYRSYRYLLRNVQRGEAVLGGSELMLERGMPFRGLLFEGWSVEGSFGSGFGFLDHVEGYPERSPFATARGIDSVWLAGADLVVIETAYAGRVSRSIVVDGFTIRR